MSTEDTYHDEAEDSGTPDEKIVKEAMRRFDIVAKVENDCRQRMIEDIKFANGDADNLWQWDTSIRNARGYGTVDERPCLTINKTRQHCLQIINDARQNKPSIKIKPVGNEATYEAAQVFEGICRHIEYISNAQAAYDTATGFQVMGGIGYWRITTDYPDYNDQSFDQEIFIRRIKDPLTVYMDPDAKEADKCDAMYGFVFDDMTRERFKEAYPKFKDVGTKSPLDVSGDWVREDQVRVAEYFRVEEKEDTLVAYTDPMTGERKQQRKSKMGKDLYKVAVDDPDFKERALKDRQVEWYLIAGDKIIDRSIWPGRYIPLVPVIGEETFIQGQLDRKGHTRAMKDPQRIYNYWSSAAVEHVALQSKTPYIGAMEAFTNLETYWDSANTVNHAWLPFNAYDDKGQKLDPPARAEPPVMSQAYIEGLKISSDEIQAVSGQFQANLGMPSNERSGRAIEERQRQGDNATYHFIDNLAIAIRNTGKQLIDLIPKIYDTERVIKIMAEDGVEHEVTVDPKAQQAYLEKQKENAETVHSIFNPQVGRYDVEADIGPAYATRRQEAFNALKQIMAADPDLMKVAGDLLFRAADFPMSEELAQRLKRIVPPQALGEGPSPDLVQATAEIQNLQGLLAKALKEVGDHQVKNKAELEQKQIDWYKAVTDRAKLLLGTITTPAERDAMAHAMFMQEHATAMEAIKATHAASLEPDEPEEPAQAA